MASGWGSRGISQRSLTKLLAKILTRFGTENLGAGQFALPSHEILSPTRKIYGSAPASILGIGSIKYGATLNGNGEEFFKAPMLTGVYIQPQSYTVQSPPPFLIPPISSCVPLDPGPRLEVDEEEVLHEVPRTFLSLALGSSLIQHHWKKFDTKSPLLLTLTRALSPAVLRMGGSSANFLTYDPDARSQVTGEEEEEEVTINEGEATYDKEREMEIHGDDNNSTFDYFYEEEEREEGRIGGKGEDDPIIGGFNEGEEEKEYDEDLYEEEEEEEKEYDEDVYEEEEREKGINISTQLPENEYESEYDINYEEEEGETPITVSTQTPNEDEDESEYDEGDYEEGRENESEFADCKCASSKQVFKNFTMTAHDWRILQDFARDVGMSLLFDVNQFYRRGGDGSWDPTNARLLMRDTSDRGRGGGGGDVLWQLGNEPNAYNHKFSLRIPPEQTAADYLRLREELDRNFSHAAVVGPDVTRPKKMNRKLALKMSSLDYLATFLSTVKINLTAVTWHQYYVNGRTATLENFLSPEVFDQLVWQVDEVIRVRDQLSPGTPVWLTETSSAWGGGAPGLSNAFVGGFLWLDKLGVAARGGISLVARQTLYDGCYALLDQDLNPYPDYWISVLYKRLVGSRVLKLTLRDAPRTLRLYAHCYKAGARDFVPGSVVIYGENLSEDPVTLDLQGRLGDSPILQYLVQAPEGQLRSRVIMLNGQRLRMTSSNALPHMRPRVVAEGEIVVPATSLGFWVLPHAQLRACL
ncbi:heparanase-like [Penaeus japonicus]|uniref:heparanase-like n=1 Tax=Penaeus japonicus TaxID=27405 RepID=UPI001C71692B|nr:heparanase-like [Penaeus japonicus]